MNIEPLIVALRNEKGSYNVLVKPPFICLIVALRNEKGSYNHKLGMDTEYFIVALRNEKGSYNEKVLIYAGLTNCSTAK